MTNSPAPVGMISSLPVSYMCIAHRHTHAQMNCTEATPPPSAAAAEHLIITLYCQGASAPTPQNIIFIFCSLKTVRQTVSILASHYFLLSSMGKAFLPKGWKLWSATKRICGWMKWALWWTFPGEAFQDDSGVWWIQRWTGWQCNWTRTIVST